MAADERATPVLTSERLTLRPATAADADAIARILAEPTVAAWWGANDRSVVLTEIEAAPSYAIVIDDEVAGWLQVHEQREPEYRHVAFDIALTASRQGRGYGVEALRTAIEHFAAAGHHRFTIDPAADNERAIRAYAKVGFKPVGLMRAYERAPDGRWRDGLLMDLLAAELGG